MREARLFTAADLRAGLEAEFERHITAADVAAFAELSHDWNPLHLDDQYARKTNYGKRIVHGAFQVGLASALTAMYLPGREVVVGSFQCRFPAPLYYPSRVRVHGEISSWVPHSSSGTLRVQIIELSTGVVTSEVRVGFSLHQTNVASVSEPKAPPLQTPGRPIVLLTGASGGLGRPIAELLSRSYHVLALARTRPVPTCYDTVPDWVTADLATSDWELEVTRKLQGRRLYGLVHAAWPAGPPGSLLDASADAIRAQIEFGALGTIRIARFLRSQASDGGARLVALGSTAGTIKPVLNMAAYSLGKATLEHTVRLLAPELARSNITVNMVAPSFIPVGMNAIKTGRAVLAEAAKVPLGRLCSPEDVAGTVDFFLSSRAAFVTGQILPLTGGQL